MLTPGNVADISVADTLTEDVYGCAVAEDMGSDSDAHRAVLPQKGRGTASGIITGVFMTKITCYVL